MADALTIQVIIGRREYLGTVAKPAFQSTLKVSFHCREILIAHTLRMACSW